MKGKKESRRKQTKVKESEKRELCRKLYDRSMAISSNNVEKELCTILWHYKKVGFPKGVNG